MKALAVDTALSCITIAAKNDDNFVSLTLDIGMRQSEKLLPAIEYVLKEIEVLPSQLDYMALCSGPGSFTGLRLSFAALKAIELAGNVPLYGISTLDFYERQFKDFPLPVLSVIDAHKDRFFAQAVNSGKRLLEPNDYEIKDILASLKNEEKVLVAGLDADIFSEAVKNEEGSQKFICMKERSFAIENLFSIAEEKIKNNEEPMKDYDGPVYLRVSEAEQNLLDGKLK